MGGVLRYHITMFVTSEEEYAIRKLFRENNWNCLLHGLPDETVANIFQSGFGHIFPFYSQTRMDLDTKQEACEEVKTEVVSVENNRNEPDVDDDDDDYDDDDESEGDAESVKDEELDYDGETDIEQTEETDKDERTDTASETDNEDELENEDESDETSDRQNSNKPGSERRGKQLERKSPASKKHSHEKLKEMGYLRCEACGNFYFGRRSLRHHYYHVHRDLMPKPSCSVCNQEFDTYKEMQKHKRENKHSTSVWMLKSYQCDGCGKILSRYSALMSHKKYVCGKGEEEDQMLRIHPCDICGKKYKTMRDVKSHKKVVHFNVESVCDICGKVCLHRRAMHSHRRRHDVSNKTHMCKYCGKAFFSAEVLEQHIRTHTKEKPYKCPLCKYTSAVMGNITKHTVNVHKQKLAAVDLRKSKNSTEVNEQNLL